MHDPLTIVEQALEARGCAPKRRGTDQLTARCPAHEDSNPSLSVKRGDKRDVVIKCFAHCTADAVMESLGLKWTDLGEQRRDSLGQPVAAYDYIDADETLLYQVLRFYPKTFRQRRPDGNGGWTWKLGDVERVLYRLPQVRAAIAKGMPVYLVEGEKDVQAMEAAGVVATCNAGGAGKFSLNMAAEFAGAQVIIVADDDGPGRDHAAEAAYMIETADAASVTIVGPASGKDAADHLAAGHHVDEFVPLDIESKAPPEHPLARWAIDWPTFWQADEDDQDRWLLEPLFARGRGHAIYAGAKTGKSYVILAACAALATGRAFLDKPAGDPRTVLYCDYEMTQEDIRERMEEFGYGPADDLSRLHYISLPAIDGLDTEQGGNALVAAAIAVEAELVVIDTTGRAVEGEENSADTFRAFYRYTGLGLKQAGIAFVRADHAGKDVAKGQRGSSSKNDDVDVVIQMTTTDNGRRLKATHRRMGWYPAETDIKIVNGVFSSAPRMWPAGVSRLAKAFDDWGVPIELGASAIGRDYKEQLDAFDGPKGKNLRVEVQRYRRLELTDWVPA